MAVKNYISQLLTPFIIFAKPLEILGRFLLLFPQRVRGGSAPFGRFFPPLLPGERPSMAGFVGDVFWNSPTFSKGSHIGGG